MVEKKVNDFIRCPRCELNFIHKKDKLCSVCKKELEAAFLHGEDVDADLGLDFDICPICKTNYIREDEDMCAACQKERDLDKIVSGDNEEENPVSDDWTNEEEDTDGVLPDDELGHMVGITDTDEEELDALDLEDLGDFDDEEAEDAEDEEADEEEAEVPEADELEEDFDDDLDDLDDLDDDDDLEDDNDDLDDDEK